MEKSIPLSFIKSLTFQLGFRIPHINIKKVNKFYKNGCIRVYNVGYCLGWCKRRHWDLFYLWGSKRDEGDLLPTNLVFHYFLSRVMYLCLIKGAILSWLGEEVSQYKYCSAFYLLMISCSSMSSYSPRSLQSVSFLLLPLLPLFMFHSEEISFIPHILLLYSSPFCVSSSFICILFYL